MKNGTRGDGNREFNLVVHDHVPFVRPTDYGVVVTDDDYPGHVDPAYYFVTSGDAVQKALVMERDLKALASWARTRYGQSKQSKHKKYVEAVQEALSKGKKLLALLRKIRGEDIFLEVEWRDHLLWAIPKNPRKKDPIE